jgi:hypothetical protein
MRINEIITELGVGGPARQFKGHTCTKDCSGHNAGYQWAKKRNIKNPNLCPRGASRSFTSGCQIKGDEK